jgi:hypothetical protein
MSDRVRRKSRPAPTKVRRTPTSPTGESGSPVQGPAARPSSGSGGTPTNRFGRHRLALGIVLVCGALAAVLYVVFSRTGQTGNERPREAASPPVSQAGNQQLLFRITALGPSYGRLGVAPLADPAGPVRDVGLVCERVHIASGHGICLSADRGAVTTYSASLFDAEFKVQHTLPLRGIPRRARVSPDGRHGAITIIVTGDSFEGAGASMRTSIIDMATGMTIGELETFKVDKGELPVQPAGVSFQAVTFARDGNRFYATLQAGGRAHLVEGALDARAVRLIAEDIDNPSLSPDDTRIAFTRRIANGGPAARLHVLTLQGRQVTPVAETNPVDDQVEWLDNGRILYALPHGSGSSAVWSVAADGTGKPTLVRVDAYSPTAIR